MHYIIVTEFETTGESTCRVKGLSVTDANNLESYLVGHHLPCNNMQDVFEVDTTGQQVLQILAKPSFRVISQSMAIETTAIGGRTVKVQKLVWTMGKQ